jgi:hypothetical protein
MRYFIPILLTAALTAPAQVVSLGFKAGVPMTDAIPSYYGINGQLDTGRWTVGPTVEFRLYRGLSVEADFLYRGYRVNSNYANTSISVIGPGTTVVTLPPIYSASQQDTKLWDIPLLVKYKFGSKPWKPFVDAGYVWTHQSSDVTSTFECLGAADACSAAGNFFYLPMRYSFSNYSNGEVAGLGVEFKYWKVKIAPEIRYTHSDRYTKNEATLLVGFTF